MTKKNKNKRSTSRHTLVEELSKINRKLLRENSSIDRSLSSAKLFILQNYTDNANGNLPLTIENM